jgi:hypothetical protein
LCHIDLTSGFTPLFFFAIEKSGNAAFHSFEELALLAAVVITRLASDCSLLLVALVAFTFAGLGELRNLAFDHGRPLSAPCSDAIHIIHLPVPFGQVDCSLAPFDLPTAVLLEIFVRLFKVAVPEESAMCRKGRGVRGFQHKVLLPVDQLFLLSGK